MSAPPTGTTASGTTASGTTASGTTASGATASGATGDQPVGWDTIPPWLRHLTLLLCIGLAAVLWHRLGDWPTAFPANWNLGLRTPIDQFQSWVIGNRADHPLFVYFFTPFKMWVENNLRSIESWLRWIPWPLHCLWLYTIAQQARGHRVALLSVAALLLIGLFGLWEAGIATFTLIFFAVAIALLFGIPLGIVAARSRTLETVLRPLLDAMQTMPAFVYLIPVVLFFGLARTPSVVATVIYALPPVVRLTTLGIRAVDQRLLEAADLFGSSPWQRLIKVQIPLAMPSILLGINQTIMMALSIVVIAALIGAGGLGQAVLKGLQRLQVGLALEAGLAIVFMAIILDRITTGLSQPRRLRQHRAHKLSPRESGNWQPIAMLARVRYLQWVLLLIVTVPLLTAMPSTEWLQRFPPQWTLSIQQPVDTVVRWIRDNLYQIGDLPIGAGPLSDWVVIRLLNPLRTLLQDWLPWPLVIASISLIAWQAAGRRTALFSASGLLTLGLLGMWPQSMDTLSQVLVAVLLALLLGVPVGICAAHNHRIAWLVHPLLDFLQTIPSFVYLVPVIMLFNVGRVPGIIASILYAIPPVIRLTELGIRQVPVATIEAAAIFGSTRWQQLIKVELPLAAPSILLGVNQTVMMVLAMVIIAGLVGGGALGFEAVTGLARNELGRGIEAGLAIVILAMILDRITQGWASRGRSVRRDGRAS